MSIAALIRSMAAAGAPAEAIAIAVEAIEGSSAKDAARREKQAERKRKSRLSRDGSVTVAGQERDGAVTGSSSPLPKENAPLDPPKEITLTPAITENDGYARTPSPRGSRIAADWIPSIADISFAKAEGMSAEAIRLEAAKFRDYWAAKAGAGGVKLEWEAVWRNWIRKNFTPRQDHRNGKPSGLSAAFDLLEARITSRSDPDAFEADGLHGFDPGAGVPGFAGRLL